MYVCENTVFMCYGNKINHQFSHLRSQDYNIYLGQLLVLNEVRHVKQINLVICPIFSLLPTTTDVLFCLERPYAWLNTFSNAFTMKGVMCHSSDLKGKKIKHKSVRVFEKVLALLTLVLL